MLFEVLSNKLTWFAEAPKYPPFCALQLFTVPCLEEPANRTKQSLKPLPLSNAASVPLVSPGIVIVFFSQVLEALIVNNLLRLTPIHYQASSLTFLLLF